MGRKECCQLALGFIGFSTFPSLKWRKFPLFQCKNRVFLPFFQDFNQQVVYFTIFILFSWYRNKSYIVFLFSHYKCIIFYASGLQIRPNGWGIWRVDFVVIFILDYHKFKGWITTNSESRTLQKLNAPIGKRSFCGLIL